MISCHAMIIISCHVMIHDLVPRYDSWSRATQWSMISCHAMIHDLGPRYDPRSRATLWLMISCHAMIDDLVPRYDPWFRATLWSIISGHAMIDDLVVRYNETLIMERIQHGAINKKMTLWKCDRNYIYDINYVLIILDASGLALETRVISIQYGIFI